MTKFVRLGTAGMAVMVVIGFAAQPSQAQLAGAAAASEVRQASGDIKAFLAKHKCFAAAEQALVKQLEDKGIEAEHIRVAFNSSKPEGTAAIELGQDNPGIQVRVLQGLKKCRPPVAKDKPTPSREKTPPAAYKPPPREGD